MIRTKDLEKKKEGTHFWPMPSPKASNINYKRIVTLCVLFLLCILNTQECSSEHTRRFPNTWDDWSLLFSIIIKWSVYLNLYVYVHIKSRSQWPRGLRHELSSLAPTLGSWIRIPLNAWMSVCAFILCVLFCVQVAALRWADHSSKESSRLCKKDYETEEEARAQQRAVRAIDEWMNEWTKVHINMYLIKIDRAVKASYCRT
jgi:hypothetical protein